ncbi:MAG: LCCL domain-containing protein [Fimbriiglobus sp.]
MFETLLSFLSDATLRNLQSLPAITPTPAGDSKPMLNPELLTSSDELPPEARELITQAEATAREVRTVMHNETTRLRAALEDEIQAMRKRTERDICQLEVEVTRKLAPVLRSLFDGLRGMQEHYTKQGKLDEALAIRANIRQLRSDLLGIRPDPGSLSDLGTEFDDRVLLFEVLGRTDGSLWGHQTYTLDSQLGVSAVHAGVLKTGMRGVVKVTILGSSYREFPGMAQNNITSSEYNGSSRAYRVEALE